MENIMKEQFKDNSSVVIHNAATNANFWTFDGIPICCERLYAELISVMEEELNHGKLITKISFVGYSLGGLYIRYLIGLLETLGFFHKVEPISFTTFATPHVGSYYHSTKLFAQIMNFGGILMLGPTGRDLFGTNRLLLEMADPEQRYYKGLKRFKHLTLFANTRNDRTVPWYTSYITNKSPFRVDNRAEFVYFDHTLAKNIAQTHSNLPFLLDMRNSVYKELAIEKRDRTVELCEKLLFYSILPFGMPFVFVALFCSSLFSNLKLSIVAGPDPTRRAIMYEELSRHIEKKGPQNRPTLRKKRRQSSFLADSAARVTENFVEDLLDVEEKRRGKGSDPVQQEGHLAGVPEPSRYAGYEGLIDSTPFSLGLEPWALEIIDNLNTLPWNKYAVRLTRHHTHAEIVDRRSNGGQGRDLLVFFASLAQGFVEG